MVNAPRRAKMKIPIQTVIRSTKQQIEPKLAPAISFGVGFGKKWKIKNTFL